MYRYSSCQPVRAERVTKIYDTPCKRHSPKEISLEATRAQETSFAKTAIEPRQRAQMQVNDLARRWLSSFLPPFIFPGALAKGEGAVLAKAHRTRLAYLRNASRSSATATAAGPQSSVLQFLGSISFSGLL